MSELQMARVMSRVVSLSYPKVGGISHCNDGSVRQCIPEISPGTSDGAGRGDMDTTTCRETKVGSIRHTANDIGVVCPAGSRACTRV